MLQHFKRFLFMVKRHRQLAKVVFTHVHFLENRDRTFWGSLTEEDEDAIVALTEEANAISGPIVEIGALFGFTTQLFATHKLLEKELITVEDFSWNPFCLPTDDHRVMTHRAMRYVMQHCNTRIYEGSNRKFYETYRGERPSMIFIDADHSYEGVMEDIESSRKLGIPLISGHDYHEFFPGVMRAVDEVFQGRKTVNGTVWWHDARRQSGHETTSS